MSFASKSDLRMGVCSAVLLTADRTLNQGIRTVIFPHKEDAAFVNQVYNEINNFDFSGLPKIQ